MAERIAVYPGTFDPMTRGHFDLIARAAKLSDRLVQLHGRVLDDDVIVVIAILQGAFDSRIFGKSQGQVTVQLP